MKKFLSIFIALLLIVSLFATTAVAFAEGEETTTPTEGETANPTPTEGEEEEETPETPRETVTIDYGKLNEYLSKDKDDPTKDSWFTGLKVEMGDVKFGEYLMKDSNRIHEAFPNIKYVISGDENYDTERSNNDKIIVEYCRPSESPKGQENWQNNVNITESIRLSSSGWYLFRIVIKDKNNDVLVRGTEYYSFYAVDTSRPIVSLSTTMKNKVESGLVAGAKYSIPTSGLTSGSTDEMSSTTVNFKIYKVVNSQDVLIYDSKAEDRVTEGYEDFVDIDGAITPSEDDISDETVYKVVYSVTDAYGFTGVESKDNIKNYDASLEFNPVMNLKVVAAPAEKEDPVNVWEIVLFCIAGLSAIGIVVLLCIKPKESAAPSRVTSPSTQEEDAGTADEPQE